MNKRDVRTGDPDLDRLMTEFQSDSREFADVIGLTDDVVGQAASRDDKVRVRVSPSGQILALHIDPRAMRLASQDLAEIIMDLSRQATEDAARRVMDVARPFLQQDERGSEPGRRR